MNEMIVTIPRFIFIQPWEGQNPVNTAVGGAEGDARASKY
jgi:hypothetical protein